MRIGNSRREMKKKEANRSKPRKAASTKINEGKL
jgi:hypothetical protein